MPICARPGCEVYVKEEGALCDVCQAVAEGKVVISESGLESMFKPKGSVKVGIYWKKRRPEPR